MTYGSSSDRSQFFTQRIAVPLFTARPARVHARTLAQIAACVVPATALVGTGFMQAAGIWLFGTLILLMVHHALSRNPLAFATLIVGLIPAMMLLRGYFFYNSLVVVLAAGTAIQCLLPSHFSRLKNDYLLLCLLAAAALYWWVGYMRTGNYSLTLRILELTLSAATIRMLAGHRAYLATALAGIAICTVSIACGLLPYGPRLGIAMVGNVSIGNPIALGLSATVILLLTIAEGGRWILLNETRPMFRLPLTLLAAACLLLSTSRGSWLVTLVGVFMMLIFSAHDRKPLLMSLVTVAVTIGIISQTDRGPIIQAYYEKSVSAQNSLAKRTTGRADQWENFPRVFDASPLWGFGPGSGKAISLRFTKEGKPWHSLYLLLGTETGMIGLSALGLLLTLLFRRGFVHWQRHGEIAPLLGLVCFMVIGVSVSGIDAISGVFLGFAFMSGEGVPVMAPRGRRNVSMVPVEVLA